MTLSSVKPGDRFGRWTVISEAGRTIHQKRTFHCVCECGTKAVVVSGNLKSGLSNSCGCLKREKAAMLAAERSFKHGAAVRGQMTPEYRSYASMIKRCRYTSMSSSHRYVGRGIKVCDRWVQGEDGKTGFQCFLDDMGLKPTPKHSIDRYPNNDGNYEPGNCRWATPKEQWWSRRAAAEVRT